MLTARLESVILTELSRRIVSSEQTIWKVLKKAKKKELTEIKKELIEKLEEFATYNDSLEEIFENKEQIEVSKFYEKLPKPHALAVQEWEEGKIYYREAK